MYIFNAIQNKKQTFTLPAGVSYVFHSDFLEEEKDRICAEIIESRKNEPRFDGEDVFRELGI